MPHRVDTAMNAVKHPACHAMTDRAVAQAERQELPERHRSVLPACQLGDPLIDVGWAGFRP